MDKILTKASDTTGDLIRPVAAKFADDFRERAHEAIVSDFHPTPVNFIATIWHAMKKAGENRRRGDWTN